MSLENAKANLQEFAKELNLGSIDFDENNTCILGIDNEFSLHLTYEPHSDRLYLYSPLLDGLPKDVKLKIKLYEILLAGSMLGGQMAGGGVGLASAEELVLMHSFLEMGIGVDITALRRFAPLFVETVEQWRKMIKKVMVGEDPGQFSLPSLQKGRGLPPSSSGPGQPGGDSGYLKI